MHRMRTGSEWIRGSGRWSSSCFKHVFVTFRLVSSLYPTQTPLRCTGEWGGTGSLGQLLGNKEALG